MTETNRVPLLAIILIILVGPAFKPVPDYLYNKENLSLQNTTWLLTAWFLISFGIILIMIRGWMRADVNTIQQLGWTRETRVIAVTFGIIVGILWGFLGMFNLLQLDSSIDPFEFTGKRLLFGIILGSMGILEDLVTRGYVMHKLNERGASNLRQVLLSSTLFALYHSFWQIVTLDFITGVITFLFSFTFSMIYGFILAGLFIWGKRSLIPVVCGHSIALFIGEPFLTYALILSI